MGDNHTRSSRSPSIGLTGTEKSHPSSPPTYHQLSSTLDHSGAAYPTMFASVEPNEPYHMQEQNAFLNPSSPQPFQDPGFPGSKRTSIGSRPASLHLTNSNYSQFSNPFQAPDDTSFLIDPALQNAQSINPADIMADQETMARHSRQASLDPSSAGMPPSSHGDWQGMGSSTYGHRRAPSEHSDISAGPSPYLKQDGFDNYDAHSPMMHPQQDSGAFHNTLGLERFTLSEQSQHGLSPRHSPFPSPRVAPMQPALNVVPEGHFMLQSGEAYGSSPAPEMYSPEMTQPPQINISFAPTRQVDLLSQQNDHDALSPPVRSRGRANSAPMSRPLSPDATSPSFDPARQRSLSPFEQHFPGRESSPGVTKSSRRSSTSSVPNRDYILDLADPNRTASASGGPSVKVQKHPATFQCSLCTKRFTRAYNLRSHLRTHTDERPFVCTVCGKAFARQHDRKRHEGLHSGEKKFICKGELAGGGQWGCGRRFARADALGRHFRSEAGRVCIKPLLDEEASDRQRQYEQQAMAQGIGMAPQPLEAQGGFTLPAALLAQYPALQGFQMTGPIDEADRSHRNSFDASSQGEYYEDEAEGSGYVSGPGTAYGSAWTGGPDWASDYEGH